MFASVDGAALASEAYEKKGTYALSQMSAETINQLGRTYTDARAQLAMPDVDNSHAKAQRTIEEITAVSESFMQRGSYGAAGGGDPSTPEGAAPRPAPVPGGAAAPGTYFAANSQGSGAVAQSVVDLARTTGVYNGEFNTPKTPSPTSTENIRPLN